MSKPFITHITASQLAALIRKKRGDMSIAELAARSGVSRDVISKIENHTDDKPCNPSFFAVVKLFDSLKISYAIHR